jgi:glycosyltransferase involved in cell wall biosynthesis
MNKPKILFLLHLPPPVHGSSMVGASIKASTLINSKLEARYINLLASKDLANTGQISLSKILGFIKVWFKLLVQLISHKPDLCYLALSSTGAAFYKDFLLVLLLRLFRIKHIYHLHNKGVSIFDKKSINQRLYHFTFKKAKVILLSKHLYSDIQRYVTSKQVVICPNGIRDENTQATKHMQKQTIPAILFLSNLIESKGVFVLLEALKLLKQKNIKFSCTFIGGEGDITAAKFSNKVNELNLADSVYYAGKKYGSAKNQAFQTTDIFVLPTFYSNECFPLVLLEAMQNTLPLVSTFEGGIPDIIDDGLTGFLVKQMDVHQLADKLEELINDPDLRWQMGQAGRKKFEQHFTLPIFEQRLLSIIQSTVYNKF